ncbi:MAG: S8 family peptidase [Prolixibacteraceae bacterium]|nr:S8 family peptidase [Prolixibacteraceae bacterium]
MKQILITILLFTSIFCAANNAGQFVYWVQFNTKAGTPYRIDTPADYLTERAMARRQRMGIEIDSTDLPVNPAFTDSLKAIGFGVKHTSRWMNGAIAYLPDSIDINTVFKPSFVEFYELRKNTIMKSRGNKFSEEDSLAQSIYGNSFKQISMLNGHILHQYSKAEGIHIAVIDAGFSNTDLLPAFDSLRARNGILGTVDFVSSANNNVYREHYHGTAVLSLMAGNLPGQLVGTAPMAKYWLLRSEDDYSEFPVEEDYWIIAAEFADSTGCDVINTSLGYTEFDDSIFNHSYEQLNGSTLRISKAANKAVEKGIVTLISAGNSGNDQWYHISAPADAKNVLAVAAVDKSGQISGFSSRGFSGDSIVPKPDIAAQGVATTISIYPESVSTGSGTSFSSPIMAGMAACLVALYPEKNAFEIHELIKSLGNLYPQHDVAYGYGIPNFKLLFPELSTTLLTNNKQNIEVFPNPFENTIYISDHDNDLTTIEIFSFTGQKMAEAKLSTTGFSEIYLPELSNLPKGVYFAVLYGKKQSFSIKLLKK